jgi:hypothetical protein
MARDGNKGWVVAYAPRWLYRDTLLGDYDIWASNYSGSGAARPFKQQYQGVTDLQGGWNPVAGRKPKILQFASDGQVGTQHMFCVDKYDGDLYDLMRRCGREPALEAVTDGHAGPLGAIEAIDFAEAMGNGQLLSANAIPDTPEPLAEPSPRAPTAEPTMAPTYKEQRELLSLLREHSAALRAMAKPKATPRRPAAVDKQQTCEKLCAAGGSVRIGWAVAVCGVVEAVNNLRPNVSRRAASWPRRRELSRKPL